MQTMDHENFDPLRSLRAKLLAGRAVVAGVLSGTSADGIDVVLTRFAPSDASGPGRPFVEVFRTIPFDENSDLNLGQRVRSVLDGESLDLGQLARLNRDLGRAFGRAARGLASEHGLSLDLIASHGQTVWHHDGAAGGAATLQLGDGCEVAEAAGCAAVSDFRTRDIAAGGGGAPLLALVESELFPDLPRPALVLNLGGISNLTWMPETSDALLAFDTGPAGSLLDGFARRFLDLPFDAGGQVALCGQSDDGLLERWGQHSFFAAPPPKSTGRDTFGEAWVDELLTHAPPTWAPKDALRTATEFVAECVARGLRDFLPGSEGVSIHVAGGGVHNRALMDALQRRTGSEVISSAALGVDPDAREALGFAILGARQVLGVPSTMPQATGAGAERVLGKLSLPIVSRD